MTETDENDPKRLEDFLEKHGELGKALLNCVHGHLDAAEDLMQNSYQGAWRDEEAFAREKYQERANIAKVPHDLRFPDYGEYARHLWTTDYFCVEAGKRIHVFLND